MHWGSPRKLGGDYLGVDVNIAARVAEAAKAGEVLVSDALAERIDTDELRTGRPKRLRADGARRRCTSGASRACADGPDLVLAAPFPALAGFAATDDETPVSRRRSVTCACVESLDVQGVA